MNSNFWYVKGSMIWKINSSYKVIYLYFTYKDMKIIKQDYIYTILTIK
jgi:hypothetical protein